MEKDHLWMWVVPSLWGKGKGGESQVSAAIPSCSLIGCEVTALLHHTSPSLTPLNPWAEAGGVDLRPDRPCLYKQHRDEISEKIPEKKNAEPLKGRSEHKGWRRRAYCLGRHTEVVRVSVSDTGSVRWTLEMADLLPLGCWGTLEFLAQSNWSQPLWTNAIWTGWLFSPTFPDFEEQILKRTKHFIFLIFTG